ncbi:Phosphopantothenate--cysteine ligase CAB2 [Wickerhamiella sorbophila]|uniref:Phosphopantothenate--cysteine ligase CAB2 n=1 Tax=Wickerhamiella sorbophila TaxID=45607 RepID=A0A2T0FMF1_9ASCO|nr:Phosphopantothenate--cysteine ligase CAB2 [Wickerhamiella sorbophila]PRT56173.1 Phosphopantothenate--cysteine ligase CAB2 [Wickerhamiella sorbophila]
MPGFIRTNEPDRATALDRHLPIQPPADIISESEYFEHTKPPEYLPKIEQQVDEFVNRHNGKRRIAVVTSGGTTVPLENNTVRFIDNFSAGTRGATSTEQFLENGYAVIFLHREFSLLPYSRHYSHTTNCFLDFMEEDENGKVVVRETYQKNMAETLKKYRHAKDKGLLLLVPFTTVNQYLYTLRLLARELKPAEPSKVLFYLAAAVSDFFVPSSRIAEHKIQSTGTGKLVIDLDPVPKFLRRLVETWIPGAMIISFKLETDEKLLLSKCRQALQRYGHQLVIGNLLQTRKHEVVFVTEKDAVPVRLSQDQIDDAVEIESVFIPKVIHRHSDYIDSKVQELQPLREKLDKMRRENEELRQLVESLQKSEVSSP